MNNICTHKLLSLCAGGSFFFVGGIVRDFALFLYQKSHKISQVQFNEHLSFKKILQSNNNLENILKITSSVYLLPISSFVDFIKTKNDIDIATTFNPKESAKILDNIFGNIPRKRNFATNVLTFTGWDNNSSQEIKLDVTSTRIDTECDGKNAKMQFGVSILKDSSRRDFTFNAMYMNSQGLLFDFHNGITDLLDGKINFIGNPRQRILEDFKRIDRYHNFCKRFNLKNEEIQNIIDNLNRN